MKRFRVQEMKWGRGRTCLLHAYLFESHLQQKDIDYVLHVRPLVKVGNNEDSGVVLENIQQRVMSQPHGDTSYPKREGKTTDEISHCMISDQSKDSR